MIATFIGLVLVFYTALVWGQHHAENKPSAEDNERRRWAPVAGGAAMSDQTEQECAEMRRALSLVRPQDWKFLDRDTSNAITHALSSDCGKGFVPVSGLDLDRVIYTLRHSAGVHWALHSANGSVHDEACKLCKEEAVRLEALQKGAQ
jgi:hypothetical protein